MRILVGLSGGLDSTYTAHLLKEAGHEVIGASVVMHDFTDTSEAEKSASDVGIPYIKIDCRKRFDEYVVEKFISEYSCGRTPNPCIECNPYVKFHALCSYAENNGFDKVATGHYSSVIYENGRYFIKRARFDSKDQSYVLWKLSQKQLSMLCFPLSEFSKKEIRDKAYSLGFSSATAPESQENCFIPDDNYISFIKEKSHQIFSEGNFIDKFGNVIGKHKGILNYTVGQRKGLGVSFGEPMFVSSIDSVNNTVTLVRSGEEFFESMTVGELNFQKACPIEYGEISAQVKVRYSAKPIPCKLVFEKKNLTVTFNSPVRAVTPGQSAVFYDKDDLLLGGIINNASLI